jgi:peptidyl-prolyl cis-trans isomerase SurA
MPQALKMKSVRADRWSSAAALVALACAWPVAAQLQVPGQGGSPRPSLTPAAPATAPSPGPGPSSAATSGNRSSSRSADFIVAVVNQELVAASEVRLRVDRLREDLRRRNQAVPRESELRQQAVDMLIDERIVLSRAREVGQRVDDAELERAVASVAAQNQLTVEQLRERLTREGVEFSRFRNNVRDQMLIERVREREVQQRIRVTDGDVEDLLEQRRKENTQTTAYNIAQIVVRVSERATDTERAERQTRAEEALRRARAGENFASLVARFSDEAGSLEEAGRLGLRNVDRLPDVFVDAVKNLQVGQIAPQLIRTGAGFHVLRLAEKRENEAFVAGQTRVRHVLLRVSPQVPQEAAARRLAEFRRQITSGARSFEQVAREHSEDGSAPQGGDLGWTNPGSFVPEFEEAMNRLEPGALSEPVVSRFGVHLIQVVERRQIALDARQQRDIARNILREQKFDEAYAEWIREMRGRAYIEMRDPG